jgi:hypothetical protein
MNAVEPPFGNVLGDEEALSWLQNQPTGRLEVSVAELASLWGWGRTRVYRRLERWEQEGRIAKCGVPGGRWLVSAVTDSQLAPDGAVSATTGALSAPADRMDAEKSQELATKLSGPVPAGVHQAEWHPDAGRASGRLARMAISAVLVVIAFAIAWFGTRQRAPITSARSSSRLDSAFVGSRSAQIHGLIRSCSRIWNRVSCARPAAKGADVRSSHTRPRWKAIAAAPPPLLEDIAGAKHWNKMRDHGFTVHRPYVYKDGRIQTEAIMLHRKARFEELG